MQTNVVSYDQQKISQLEETLKSSEQDFLQRESKFQEALNLSQ